VDEGVAAPEADAVPEADAAADGDVAAVVVGPLVVPGVQAAKAAMVPAPKNNPSVRRRLSVFRSNSSPRSWSGWGVLSVMVYF
jgi:hypothetical protein